VYEVAWPEGGPALDIRFHLLNSGPILEGKGLRVSAFPVRHSGPDSFGFRFEEPPHRPLLPDRLDRLGIPEGQIRGRLARGEAVQLPDRSRIEPEDVLGPPRPGASLAVVGDTEGVVDLTPYVRGADGLIIEATFLDRDARKAQDRSHITARQAAELAAAAGIGVLWLTHISGRYAVEDILMEARAIFPNSHVAQDFVQAEIRPRPAGDAGNSSSPETLKSRTD
jgi:ribonuclease Z